ncbi:MAG: CBS domain-containing protein [Nitrososphaeraceae archaeon]
MDITLRDCVPQIFKRPYLSVLPDSTLMQIAPFLAIGPQIYVDGLVVVEGERPIGRIGSKQILLTIINSKYPDWLEVSAAQMMDNSRIYLEMDLPLSKAINIFKQTGFAFIPITKSGLVVASLTIRDVLPIITRTTPSLSLKDISSPLVLLSNKTDLKTALRIMFERKIRNMIVRVDNDYYVANDRKILEFLFSQNGRKLVRTNNMGAEAVEIDLIDMVPAIKVKENTTVSQAAELLMDINTPCLLLEGSIITPWDIVMKTIDKIHI